MKNSYLNVLLKLSKKAYKKNEMPVSCIIIHDGKIISKSYNKKNIKKCAVYHAEILCIEKACKKLKTWNLSDCEMYITLEPCGLCKEAIQESRIKNVYFILKKGETTNKFKKTKYEQMYDINSAPFSLLISNFFEKIRKEINK